MLLIYYISKNIIHGDREKVKEIKPMSNKIQFIIGIPKSPKYYSYYVNNNFKDKHLMKRDDFYFFIAKLVESPLPSQIRQLIDHNRNFIVDIKSNEVNTLTPETDSSSKDFKKQNMDQVVKQWKKEKNKKKKEENKQNFHDDTLAHIQKQLGIK